MNRFLFLIRRMYKRVFVPSDPIAYVGPLDTVVRREVLFNVDELR